jgi:hypothetical protein
LVVSIACFHGNADRGTVLIARNETRTRTALGLEANALRHQIAVLEYS